MALPGPTASALFKTAQLQGWSWMLLISHASSTALLYWGAPQLPGKRRGLPSRAIPAVAGIGHVELAHEVDGSQGTAAPGQALGRSFPLNLVVLGRQRVAPSRAGRQPHASKKSYRQPKIAPGCSGSTSAARRAETLLQMGSGGQLGPRHLSPHSPGTASGLGSCGAVGDMASPGQWRGQERARQEGSSWDCWNEVQ